MLGPFESLVSPCSPQVLPSPKHLLTPSCAHWLEQPGARWVAWEVSSPSGAEVPSVGMRSRMGMGGFHMSHASDHMQSTRVVHTPISNQLAQPQPFS